jgi:hypothetical protein
MRYQFNDQQLDNFKKISDISLRYSGYGRLEQIIHIVNILNKNEEGICQFTNIDMTILEQIFDAAIKSNGLGVADAILELTNVLRSPIQDEVKKEEEKIIDIES